MNITSDSICFAWKIKRDTFLEGNVRTDFHIQLFHHVFLPSRNIRKHDGKVYGAYVNLQGFELHWFYSALLPRTPCLLVTTYNNPVKCVLLLWFRPKKTDCKCDFTLSCLPVVEDVETFC